jgi:hypothetical protein
LAGKKVIDWLLGSSNIKKEPIFLLIWLTKIIFGLRIKIGLKISLIKININKSR